jgi:hypothetical protein
MIFCFSNFLGEKKKEFLFFFEKQKNYNTKFFIETKNKILPFKKTKNIFFVSLKQKIIIP